VRVILEKRDLISLLGKALGRKFEEKDVLIQAEPFEVIIYDAESVLVPDEPDPPSIGLVPQAPVSTPKPAEDDSMSLDDLLSKSKSLALTGPETGKGAKKRRARMAGEYDEPVNPLTGVNDE